MFTRNGEGGNPLGVVPDTTGLDPAAMQGIANDLGFSETVFLDWRAGGIPHARIFTPAREMPFAGHPLVGAGWLLEAVGPGGPGRLMCEVGEVAVRQEGDLTWIDPPFGQPVEPCSLDVAGWVSPVSAMTVSTPLPYHLFELASPEEVASAAPPSIGGELYLWAWEGPDSVKARFFAAGVGVAEDPATGSAAVALAARLAAGGMTEGRVTVHQGDELGAPSTIHLTWAGDRVSVGGTVVRDELRVLDV